MYQGGLRSGHHEQQTHSERHVHVKHPSRQYLSSLPSIFVIPPVDIYHPSDYAHLSSPVAILVWSSGRVDSSAQALEVPETLDTDTSYVWKVRRDLGYQD